MWKEGIFQKKSQQSDSVYFLSSYNNIHTFKQSRIILSTIFINKWLIPLLPQQFFNDCNFSFINDQYIVLFNHLQLQLMLWNITETG